MVNMGSVPDGVAMQSYMTFTSSILQNARVSSIASSCVPTYSVTGDLTIFEAQLQQEICDGPATCVFRGRVVDAGSFAFAQGTLSNCPSGCGGTFRVAQTGWCAVAPGQAVLRWQSSPPAPRNRHTAIVDVNSNLVQGQYLFSDYVINVVAVPSPTPTNTPTPSPTAIINGHLTWQDVFSNNRPSVTGTLLLCVSGSTQTFNFTTDTGGYFTVTTFLPDGSYHWWIKGGRHISTSSPPDGADLVISGGQATQEFGTQKGGDANADNIVNILDFNQLKIQFGLAGVRSADFDYNLVVNASDFRFSKSNQGQAGHALTCP